MFRFDNPEDLASLMHQRFVNRRVLPAELRDFALLESPFVNAKSMLRVLENRDMIEVESTNPHRRRGDFPEDTLVAVRFVPEKGPVVVQGSLFGG